MEAMTADLDNCMKQLNILCGKILILREAVIVFKTEF
jgi:hypothetical protein